MPYLDASDSEAAPSEVVEPVYLKFKDRKRFYEPIVLLLAITKAFMKTQEPKVLGHVPDVFHTLEQLFHEFMNELAHICDNHGGPGGKTVTAAVALQYYDHLEYRFASNQRDGEKVAQVKDFIESILTTLQAWTETDSELVRARVLRKVVAFNRPRLEVYVRAIYTQSQLCLAAPEGTIKPQITEKLRELENFSLEANDRKLEEPAFLKSCLALMRFIKHFEKTEAYRFLCNKVNAARGQITSWSELRHSAGRLLTYYKGVKTLIEARMSFDRLFHDFKVVVLPSSSELTTALPRNNVTAQDMIGRMTSDNARAKNYKRIVQDLQRFGLDENVRSRVRSKSFCPIVHAEVLVHQSIVSDPELKDLHPVKFFDGYKYIGSSKPTCRLCHYYFAACADGIEVRQTSRNLYHNWRFPDIYPAEGEGAVRRRDKLLNKMLASIREDTFRTLDEKVPEKRPHDSNTDPTYKHGTSVGYTDGCVEDIAEALEGLSVEDTLIDGHSYSHDSQGGLTEADQEDDDDDDDGGVRIS